MLLYFHKQSLCYSMKYLFSNLSRKYCCDANIVAIKCVPFESVDFDQLLFLLAIGCTLFQLLSTANAKDFNTDFFVRTFVTE